MIGDAGGMSPRSSGDRPASVEVDGEPRGRTPLRIGLDPNALRLMAPVNAPDR